MMRLLFVTVLTTALGACQNFDSAPDRRDELARLLEFHQTLPQREDAALVTEADRLRDQLAQDAEAPAAMHLQLLILESRIQLRELQQIHDTQLQQIQALNTQIEALTVIEQQINRRGQLQEADNE